MSEGELFQGVMDTMASLLGSDCSLFLSSSHGLSVALSLSVSSFLYCSPLYNMAPKTRKNTRHPPSYYIQRREKNHTSKHH